MSRVTSIRTRLTFLNACIILFAFMLSGCNNMPLHNQHSDTQAINKEQEHLLDYAVNTDKANTQSSQTTPKQTQQIAKDNETILLNLVREAKQSSSPKREALLIKATHTALGLQKIKLAQKIYALINKEALTTKADIDYYYELIGLELAVAQNNKDTAQAQYQSLDAIANNRKIPLNHSHYAKDSKIRASALALQQDYLSAARLLVFRFEGLNDHDSHISQNRHNQIWHYMSLYRQQQITASTQQNSLAVQLTTAPSEEWQAWLELSDIFEQNDRNRLSYMQGKIQIWQENWPSTHVAKQPPADVNELLIADFQKATHVAVFLPTSGPLQHAGKAIIDGIMASYYLEQKNGERNLKLSFYNTASTANITSLYKKAHSLNVDFIIGPLKKENVAALKKHVSNLNAEDAHIPVLALNYTQNNNTTIISRHFFEFGLSAEDEAASVARYTFRNGLERALVLRPDSDWGKRVANAFTTEFKTMNGNILDQATYTQPRQFSKEVQKLLGIKISQTRHKQMERDLGKKLDYRPRRRQDVDFIFLLASPNEARQLKPTINYHYGQDIPVFSTSHLYTGNPNPQYDKDLNNITFTDIPWILNQDTALKRSFEQNIPRAQSQLKRLHALGIDAFQLMREFPVLKYVSSSSLPGATGTLVIKADGRVKRTLSWATFKKGNVVPLKDTTIQQ